MNFIEYREKEVEIEIKIYKKAIASQAGFLIINLLGLFWNLYELIIGDKSSLFPLGLFFSNTLWTIGNFFKDYQEYRLAKIEQKIIKQSKMELENAKNIYESKNIRNLHDLEKK